MNILLIGGGGREHAIADKVVTSPQCSPSFHRPWKCRKQQPWVTMWPIDVNDFAAVKNLVIKEDIGLVIVGT
jgi:phosphoribosylamine--glycine ligase